MNRCVICGTPTEHRVRVSPDLELPACAERDCLTVVPRPDDGLLTTDFAVS